MKKVLLTLLTAAMLCCTIPAHAFTPEKVESVPEKTKTQVSAKLNAEILPGKNLLTGTQKAVSFDTASDLASFTVVSNFPEKNIDVAWQESNQSMLLAFPEARDVLSGGHHQAIVTADLGTTLDRPAYFTVSAEGVYTICEFGGAWVYQNISESYRKDTVMDNAKAESWNTDKLTFRIWNVENYRQNKYLDNIAVIPYYRVTYKNIASDGQPLGADIVAYTLGASAPTVGTDGTITVAAAFSPSCSLSAPGVQFLGWSTEEGGAPMNEIPLAGEDLVLYPVWGEMSFAPGVNLLTGTQKALTFDSEADVSLFTAKPVYDPTKMVSLSWDGEGRRMKMHFPSGTDASGHFVAELSASLGESLDRPAFLTSACHSYYMLAYFMNDGQIGENLTDTARTDILCGTNAGKPWNTDTLSLNVWNIYGYESDKYFDNMAVIPYYRVTYKSIDREGNSMGADKIGYTLGDTSKISVNEDGTLTLPESFVPEMGLVGKGTSLLGWSLERGATEPMDEIPLGDSDIVLYPVWGDVRVIPGANLFTGTKKALTFDSAEELSYFNIASKWDSSVSMDLKYDAENARMQIDFPSKIDASGHFVALVSADLGTTLDRPAVLALESRALYVFYEFGKDGIFYSDVTGEWNTAKLYANNAGEPWNTDKLALSIWNIYGNGTSKYLDNLAVIPYYKVTYKNIGPDGTPLGEDSVEYTIGDASLLAVASDGTITTSDSFLPEKTLSDERFLGWSTKAGGAPMTEIPFEGEDIVLYPVYKAPELPFMTGELSLRTSGVQGIRFKAHIAAATHLDSQAYGFIVTRRTLLETAGLSDSAFVIGADVPYASGVSYREDREINYSYDCGDGQYWYFAAVLRGIPQTKAYYTEKMVVRPYVTVAGVTYYGEAQCASVENAVNALLQANPEAENDAFVKAVLDTLGR